MKKIELSDIKNLHEYELIRDDWRREVIAVKARRRVLLGDRVSLVFENRLTALNQIQEMCRIERIVKPEAVQAEVDVYNEILPGPGEVAATLFVEIPGTDQVKVELDRFIGLGQPGRLSIDLGGRRVPASFLEGQEREDRISAVQYVRFRIGDDEGVRRFLESSPEPVRVVVDHPSYRAEAALSEATRRELAQDLVPE